MSEITGTRAITSEELEKYKKAIPEQYAEEMFATGCMTKEEAYTIAKDNIDRLLPEGRIREDYHMEVMIDQSMEVGFVWYGQREISGYQVVYIYDLEVYNEYRRKGYGDKIMNFLENYAKNKGIEKIVLNVFLHNKGAVALYDKHGYRSLASDSGQSIMVKDLIATA